SREVEQRVQHELPWAVIGNVAAAVAAYHGDAVRHCALGCPLAECVDRLVFSEPDLLGGVGAARKRPHVLQDIGISGQTQLPDGDFLDDGHSTITTPGW